MRMDHCVKGVVWNAVFVVMMLITARPAVEVIFGGIIVVWMHA